VARKGRLEEIFSEALYSSENPDGYVVSYRDFQSVVEVSLPEFVKLSENFDVIPASRILMVKRGGEILYRKRGATHQ
jgi:uncharacterized protein (UPF0248 family)